MDPDAHLAELGRRHDVPAAFGRRLRPLIVRAENARPDLRERILGMVERSFAEEADRRRAAKAAERCDPDSGALESVARVLHPWQLPRFGAGKGEA